MFSDLFLKMQKWNFWLLKRVQNKPIPPLSPLQYRCGGHLGFRDGKGSPHHFQNIAPFKFFKISFSTRVQSVTLLSQLCGLVAHCRPQIPYLPYDVKQYIFQDFLMVFLGPLQGLYRVSQGLFTYPQGLHTPR